MSEPAGTAQPAFALLALVTQLGEVYVLLMRHRGGHRVGDGFCSVTHLRDWAKAGGRWR